MCQPKTLDLQIMCQPKTSEPLILRIAKFALGLNAVALMYSIPVTTINFGAYVYNSATPETKLQAQEYRKEALQQAGISIIGATTLIAGAVCYKVLTDEKTYNSDRWQPLDDAKLREYEQVRTDDEDDMM